MMNYEAEVKDLESKQSLERLPWLELKSGQHRITFLSEGTEFTYTAKDGTERQKVAFEVEFEKMRYMLSTARGKTLASLYGQILIVAARTEPVNSMKGKTINVAVKMINDHGRYKREFTVMESLELMK
jgi:hypothetical protein